MSKKRINQTNNKGITMDEKYVLELGKILNSIDNLIKVQDKNHTEFKELLEKQKDKTESDIKELKAALEKEKEKCEKETKILNQRIEKLEKFDIKVIAYSTIAATIVTLSLRFLPMLEIFSHSAKH